MPLLCCEEGVPLAALVPNLMKHAIKPASLPLQRGGERKSSNPGGLLWQAALERL